MTQSLLREIVLDTETTGVDTKAGDRIIEIGCVELLNHIPTGNTYHCYINPKFPVSEGAFAVHGLSDAFLADKPVFADVADAFLTFIAQDALVIHNAAFDVGFINAEFEKLSLAPLENTRVVDTLLMARRKHPGASNSLDALCSRYGVDASKRSKHGALLDSFLLADVYVELLGGRQTGLAFDQKGQGSQVAVAHTAVPAIKRPQPLPSRLTSAVIETHTAFVKDLSAKTLWQDYYSKS